MYPIQARALQNQPWGLLFEIVTTWVNLGLFNQRFFLSHCNEDYLSGAYGAWIIQRSASIEELRVNQDEDKKGNDVSEILEISF